LKCNFILQVYAPCNHHHHINIDRLVTFATDPTKTDTSSAFSTLKMSSICVRHPSLDILSNHTVQLNYIVFLRETSFHFTICIRTIINPSLMSECHYYHLLSLLSFSDFINRSGRLNFEGTQEKFSQVVVKGAEYNFRERHSIRNVWKRPGWTFSTTSTDY